MNKRLFIAVPAILTLAFGAACSSSDSASDSSASSNNTSSNSEDYSDSSPEESSEDSSKLHPAGEATEAEGVTLTVDKVSEPAEIEMYEHGRKRESAGREYRTPSRPDAKFVRVDTTVLNTGKKPMGLTCSFGVQGVLFNTDEQQFDSIDGKSDTVGNPDCSDSLNPGFDSKMSWIFEVPKNTESFAFGFSNPEYAYDDLTFVDAKVTAGSSNASTDHDDSGDSSGKKSSKKPAPTSSRQTQDA